MECHHPFGRLGERILAFVWVCGPCHQMIHDEGQQARAMGWLQPEFDGRSGPAPRPWQAIREGRWPKSLQRDGQEASLPCPSEPPRVAP